MIGVISDPSVTSYEISSMMYVVPLYVKLQPFSGMCMVLIGNLLSFTLNTGCISTSIFCDLRHNYNMIENGKLKLFFFCN
jgi:hypothetical protein